MQVWNWRWNSNSFFKSIVAISRPFLSLAAIPDVQILIKGLRDMKGGEKRRKDRKKKKKSGSNGVPSPSLPAPSPFPFTLRRFFLLDFFCAVSAIWKPEQTIQTHPPSHPPVVVRPGYLVQNKRCFSLRPYSPLRYVRQNPIAINHNTVVEYNAADIANGGVHNKRLYPMSGKLLGNVIGDVRKQLMDPDNMDFRPKQDSSYIQDDVGPYNYEESKTKYWIPGRIQYKVTGGCVCLNSCGFIYYYAVSTR